MERVTKGIAWIVFTFSDGTKQCLRTTLSKEVLEGLGVTPRENALYDMEQNLFVPFRKDAIDVAFFDEKPLFEQEVLQFASRFI